LARLHWLPASTSGIFSLYSLRPTSLLRSLACLLSQGADPNGPSPVLNPARQILARPPLRFLCLGLDRVNERRRSTILFASKTSLIDLSRRPFLPFLNQPLDRTADIYPEASPGHLRPATLHGFPVGSVDKTALARLTKSTPAVPHGQQCQPEKILP
ncbi:hypothetical protein PTTG_27131, partial [Puccinia triticina 1-1 BBBD Race 1]